MKLKDLELVQVATGIAFGQECYLDRSRAQKFLDEVNEISPNFLTRPQLPAASQRVCFDKFQWNKTVCYPT